MSFLLANAVFLISSIGYGWLAGSDQDRQAVGWIIAALFGTLAVNVLAAPEYVVLLVFVMDSLLQAAITRIALRSESYWPTWFAGWHLAGLACAAAAFVAPVEEVTNLRRFAGFWDTFALLAMVFGIFLDRRADARLLRHEQPST